MHKRSHTVGMLGNWSVLSLMGAILLFQGCATPTTSGYLVQSPVNEAMTRLRNLGVHGAIYGRPQYFYTFDPYRQQIQAMPNLANLLVGALIFPMVNQS